ncbi:response regulator transcription factor [Eubacterium sp. 1001713B170207_170306_E7]|uniref:response regulator transcription factor n=1 Tax=Eubacterium sp. 1001713B170207_170306_E7 TaxID=2787097 RepID=UPI00189A2315|nr:response regulator transcription factor [Eubacterium sp. 1001713B170207_170306_E7]
MKRILVVEDDEMLGAGLCYNLELEGFKTVLVQSFEGAEKRVEEGGWDMVILDVNLPDGDGFSLAKKIRLRARTPLIFLTACDLDDDILKGFELGADDYITKPFNIKIVIKRINAVFRRSGDSRKERFICGNLEIDFDRRTACKNGEPLILTPTEFKLLQLFCENPGKVLTRKMLLESLWDNEGNFVDEHTLTINVSRLRSKISDDAFAYIKTIYGMGYEWMGEKDA